MEIRVEVKGAEPASVAAAVAKEFLIGLGLHVPVKPVPYGTLPIFELKAKQLCTQRRKPIWRKS
jgi:hypothetical protein